MPGRGPGADPRSGEEMAAAGWWTPQTTTTQQGGGGGGELVLQVVITLPGMMLLQGPPTAPPSRLLHPVLLRSKPCQCREQSRSLRQGYALRSRFLETTDYHLRRKGRWRASPPRHDRAPRDDAAAGPSNASSKRAPTPRAAREHARLWQREQSRSPHQGYDLCSWFVDTTECDPSAGRRKVSAPQRCTSGNHSRC